MTCNRAVIMAAGLVTIFCAGSMSPAAAQVDARFGTREARSCTGMKGPPTNANVAQLVQCTMEGPSGDIMILRENLNLQVGQPRRFLPNADVNMTDVNGAAMVYPIRGSGDEWICAKLSDIQQNKGRNCERIKAAKAHGTCWNTNFGDWKCSLTSEVEDKQYNLPPPGR